MSARIIIPLLTLILVCCNDSASEKFAECGAEVIAKPSRIINFPFSELGIRVPDDWLYATFADQNVETVYVADSVLYADKNITLSLSLSSNKNELTQSQLKITNDDFSSATFSTLVDEGSTKCYNEECIYRISSDSSMTYVSFLFVKDSRLRIINLSTTNGDGKHDRLCTLMSLLTEINL